MDQLAALRVFIDVVRTGNLSETARHLGLAPSSVTRQINGLESRLGVRLLNRTTRHVSLTEAGRIYQERARRLLGELDDLDRAVTELDASPRGTLRVSAPVVLGRVQVAPRVPELLRRFPEVSVELSLNDQVVDLVEDGIDVALRIAVELPDSTLIARRLFTMRRIICASPGYLAARGIPRTPEDLNGHECLTFRLQTTSELWRPGARQWRLSGAGPTAEIRVSGRFESNNGDALVEAAVSGHGLVLVPAWHVAEHVHSGRLVPVLTDYQVNPSASESSVFVVYPSNRHLSPKVRAFVEFATEVFRAEPFA